jgi:hypothetical protein
MSDAAATACAWQPAGAKSHADFGLLNAAEDIVARRRTRQRW